MTPSPRSFRNSAPLLGAKSRFPIMAGYITNHSNKIIITERISGIPQITHPLTLIPSLFLKKRSLYQRNITNTVIHCWSGISATEIRISWRVLTGARIKQMSFPTAKGNATFIIKHPQQVSANGRYLFTIYHFPILLRAFLRALIITSSFSFQWSCHFLILFFSLI